MLKVRGNLQFISITFWVIIDGGGSTPSQTLERVKEHCTEKLHLKKEKKFTSWLKPQSKWPWISELNKIWWRLVWLGCIYIGG